MVPEVGVEPTCLATQDFKSCAYTIPPLRHMSLKLYRKNKQQATKKEIMCNELFSGADDRIRTGDLLLGKETF